MELKVIALAFLFVSLCVADFLFCDSGNPNRTDSPPFLGLLGALICSSSFLLSIVKDDGVDWDFDGFAFDKSHIFLQFEDEFDDKSYASNEGKRRSEQMISSILTNFGLDFAVMLPT